MTRDEKLEAMARAWCLFNGWQPDHCPLALRSLWIRPGCSPTWEFERYEGEPIWKAHIKAMDAILKAVE